MNIRIMETVNEPLPNFVKVKAPVMQVAENWCACGEDGNPDCKANDIRYMSFYSCSCGINNEHIHHITCGKLIQLG